MAGVSVGNAFVDIAPRLAQGFAKNLETQIGAPSKVVAKQVESSMGGAFKKVAAGAGAAFAAVKIAGFFKDSIAAARESNKVAAQTAAVIASTGGAANVTAAGVDKLANSIARKTGIDDEAIASAANLLLTFTNIRNEAGKTNDVFSQATKIAVDMGAALGGDAASNSILLGKALNDPVQGLTALTRVGVTFTAQQKDQIKTLAESGDMLGAQKIILAELNKEFGGSAEAQSTAAGKMKVAFGNLEESIGNVLIPVIDGLSKSLSGLIGWFTDAPAGVKALAAIAGTLAAGIVAVTVATKAWTIAQAALDVVMDANPIVLIGLAIGALVAGIVVAWKSSETFRDIVKGAFQATANAVGDAVGWILDYVDKLIGAYATAAEAASHIPGVGGAFAGVADTLRGLQHDVQGWADTLHKGISITGDAADASDTHTKALKGEAAATAGVTDATKAAADALAGSLKSSVTSMLDPLKTFQKTATEALSLSKVKDELNNGQEWEKDYRKLSAAAKAGLEPATKAAADTVLSIAQLKTNLTKGIADVKAWKADLATLTARGFGTLSVDLAQLGPAAAPAVDQATRLGKGALAALQAQFAEADLLKADPTIASFVDGLTAAAPKIGAGLHDALVAAGPVLTPEEAIAYMGIYPWANPGGDPAGNGNVPWDAPGSGSTVFDNQQGVDPAGNGSTPWDKPAPAAPPVTIINNVHPAAATSSRQIAADIGDHVAWRLGPSTRSL